MVIVIQCTQTFVYFDCINRPQDLIDNAIKKGLSGIAITDHESLSAHMEINIYAKKIRQEYPDFTIALGNEIYLVDERKNNQQYYHFILIAKDDIGYLALKELSSIAWYHLYVDRRMERVPTLKSELTEIVNKYKGHLIATSACAGGELSKCILKMIEAENNKNLQERTYYYNQICNFISYCLELFGEDFYIECAPSQFSEQIIINKKLHDIAQVFNIKMTVGSDAHFINEQDRFIHKAYLTSHGGEREVDDFYKYAYLQDTNEVINNLTASYNNIIIEEILKNTLEIQSKIEFFDLENKQKIPEVNVQIYPKKSITDLPPVLTQLFLSDNIQERYWVNECYKALKQKGLYNNTYINRLEEEARVKKIIGEKLDTCMFAYPNTLQHYINLFWDCGSTVGAGRGSACSGLNHYLLGITQLDPIKWDLPFWRYLNDERVELGDIDIDLSPSKRPLIFKKIREERGEFGLVQVATFGTEATKSAILTACRGYRSEDYPDGIDVDEAQYLSSLVPIERGFLWTIKDLTEGNPAKGRSPNKTFINAISQYPGLLDIVKNIEGLVSRRGTHASGVMLLNTDNPFSEAAIMRSPDGSLITQWDLHMQEAHGGVKYDFLVTKVQDIIIQTIALLQEYNIMNKNLQLRDIYNQYLHPEVLELTDEMWTALEKGNVLGCFQFDSTVGMQAANKIKPKSPMEMADANGLMRLMTAEKGEENPIDKYVRYKNNISLWYQEMDKAGLTKEEQSYLEPYFLSSYGVPPSQEQLMKMLMDPNICNFTLGEANLARKVVGKKLMDQIPALAEKVISKASSVNLGRYVWKYGAGPQMGYSFSIIHALSYSFVGLQTLYLATKFNPIYWNTAYLIVNSGSLETENQKGTDYQKLSKALGDIKSANISISLADINKSQFGFVPNAKDNTIYFGLKAITGIGDELVNEIIAARPYRSVPDFYERVKPKRQSMVSLIKGGAFDSLMDRKLCMAWFIWETCDKKKNLTLQNMPGLIKYNVIPTTGEYEYPYKIYEFTRYLKKVLRDPSKTFYTLDNRALEFLSSIGKDDLIKDNNILMAKTWDNIYQKVMDKYRAWINNDKANILQTLNERIFKEDWDKYSKSGNLSAWEMEALCFYYHEHELANINLNKYGISQFSKLPEEPIIADSYRWGGRMINILSLDKIVGTCIAKDKAKGTVTVLTTDGVINIKFRKEVFSIYDKQISRREPDGSKKVVERSWFNKGGLILVQGFRSGDNFIPKKYKSSSMQHTIYRIDKVLDNGDLILRSERYQGEEEDDNEEI